MLDKAIDAQGGRKSAVEENQGKDAAGERRDETSEVVRPTGENDKAIVYRIDAEGRWVALGSPWTTVTGFSIAESIGRLFVDFLHPEVREKSWETFRMLIDGEIESGWGQLRCFTKQGEVRWLEAHFRPLLAGTGAVEGVAGTLLDVTDSILAAEPLRDSGNRYRQLGRNSCAVKMIVDPEASRIVAANNAAAVFYDYSVAELKRMKLLELDATPVKGTANYQAAATRGRGYLPSAALHLRAERSSRQMAAVISPASLGGKMPNPITPDSSRHLLSEELARGQERLALALAGAQAGVWDWDMASGHVYYDERWKAIIGYAGDEIGSGFEEWSSRWHPADVARIEQAIADYQAGYTPKFAVEHRLRHQDGTYRWVLTTGQLVRDRLGRAVRWAGFTMDITDRKLAEELLVDREVRLCDFAQNVPDASFIIDEEGLCVEAFGSCRELTLAAGDELPGRTLQELLPAAEAAKLLEEIRQTTAAGAPRTFVVEREAAGKVTILEGRAAPMQYAAGGKKTVALIVHNITERRRAERMLDYTYQLRRRSDFINDLIEGKAISGRRDSYYAQTLGLDSPIPTFCCLAINDFLDSTKGYHRGEKGLGLQKLKEKAIQALEDVRNAVAWDCREGIGVLCRLPSGGDCVEASLVTAAAVQKRLQRFFPESPLFIGVSEIYNHAGNIGKLYREAYSAVLAARVEDANQAVVHYRNAGILQFLPAVGSREVALEFVQRQLGCLLEYDWKKGTDYLTTLEELLRGASVRETAEKLFLHPKTLLFRRKRIQAILQVSLDSPDTRLALALAIKLLRLYNKL